MSGRSKIIIVRGLPGSGKSTFCHTKFPNILHLENDFFHYHDLNYEFDARKQRDAVDWCIDMTESAAENGLDVCVSNTFTRRNFVECYRRIAQLFDRDFEVYRMMGTFKNIHDVPKAVYNSMLEGFEDYPDEKYVFPLLNHEYDIIGKMEADANAPVQSSL